MTFVENPRLRRLLLSAIGRAWKRGEPLSMRPADGDRFVARVIARGKIGVAIRVENELFAALRAKEIHEEVVARKPLTFGLRLAERAVEGCGDVAETSPARLRTSPRAGAKRLRGLTNFDCGNVRGDAAETRRRHRKPLKKLAETICGDALIPSVAGNKRTAGAWRAAPAVLLRQGEAIEFGAPFEAGDVLLDRGQRFVCVEVVPCVRKDGTPSAWTIWHGECADCGAPFGVKAYSKTWRPVQRRCDLHKSPLHRTKFGRGRRAGRRVAQ